ncbi:hypothetical protein CJ030_MR8G002344 [Morella rubra]|uniref:Uncharacterized protein n=1 Tax=Morella rubra TaxID=262757 RepID=A0A6A1UNM2_9ROSI|nr:hypothetical protein CJ030_MR8G002344 [Morella rubra]
MASTGLSSVSSVEVIWSKDDNSADGSDPESINTPANNDVLPNTGSSSSLHSVWLAGRKEGRCPDDRKPTTVTQTMSQKRYVRHAGKCINVAWRSTRCATNEVGGGRSSPPSFPTENVRIPTTGGANTACEDGDNVGHGVLSSDEDDPDYAWFLQHYE